MAKCPLFDLCWRRAYTEYVRDNNISPCDYEPPERIEMLLEGYASQRMCEINNGRHRGVFAEIMPMPGENSTYCPEMVGKRCEECHEYKKNGNLVKAIDKKRSGGSGKARREYVSRSLRRAVARRDKYTCVYCGERYQSLKRRGIKCQIDHFVPVAKGGRSNEENLVFSCETCNNEKGANIWPRGKKRSL